MKKKIFLIITGFIFLGFSLVMAADIPIMLNYQGYVKYNDGVPINGNGYFKFAIIDPNGNTTYWSNDGTSTTGGEPNNAVKILVTNGIFTTKLGNTDIINMSALPSDVFDQQNIFIRVWFSDNNITFEQLAPDTQIVSAGFAYKSQKVVDNEAIFLVPIGGIIAYFGDPNKLPDKWMVCDGSMVEDSESPLNSMMLPDLREKFIRGEAESSRNVLGSLEEGGYDNHIHDISLEDAGIHIHNASIKVSGTTSFRKAEVYGGIDSTSRGTGNHDHTFSATVNFDTQPEGKHTHTATVSEVSHLPSYVALHYIIRIK